MTQPLALYVNPKQAEFLAAPQKTKMFLGGRGIGKSSLIGMSTRRKASALPRAKNFFASTTYNQILTKTLPAIESIWQDMKMIEGVHYVIGRKPPKHFRTPLSPPRKYQNVITLLNGFCVEMLSMDRSDLARGGSYDGGEIDEMALIDGEDYRKILIPSVRGNRHRFSSHLHQQVCGYTSIPWKPSGYYIYEFEEKAKANPDKYFFLEGNAYDNIAVLGQEGIDRMEEEMTYLEFQIEVLNQRIRKLPNGFYSAFDDKKHLYQVTYSYDDSDENWRDTKVVPKDMHYNSREALDLTFDFSGWFNCCWVFQERQNYEYAINSFFVKGDEKLGELVRNFCNHYEYHQFKFIRLWGEPRGWDRQPLTKPMFESLRDMFTAAGWECEIWAPAGHAANHADRYQFMDDVLKETRPEMPRLRVNEETCKAPVIAMQSCDIKLDFQKNKEPEKNRDFPQEHAPHFTDALDYYLLAKHGWKTFGNDDEMYTGFN